MSRLQQLESALSDPEYDGEVEYFFVEDEIEDADFTPYCGNIQSFTNEIDVDMSHPCLHGSGFGSVVICDQGGESTTQLSPWDVSVPAPSNHAAAPERPKLSEDERARVRKALKSIRSLPRVDNYFLFPVEAAYSDYTSRVEVPMDLTFITNRLEADYYGTRYSAVADARLIYYNSIKYNGEDSLSELARELFEKFEEQVLDEKERAIFHKYDAPIVGVQPTASLEPSEALPNTSRNSFAGQRRSQRHGPVRSDLENLPASDESARVQLRQNGHRARPASRQNNVRLRRVGEVTSVLETARIVTVRTLEQLSSSRGQSSRGRSTRSATSAASASAVVTRQGRPASTQARGVPLRATRAGLRNLTFAQVSADVDETGRAQFASTRGILNGRAERSSRRAETRAQFSLPELALSEQVAGSEARSSRQMHISTANGSSSRPTRSSARAISRSSLGVGDLLQTEVNASAGRRWPSVGTDQDGPSETDEDKLSTPRRRSPRRASGGEASTQSQRYVASIHNHSDTEDVDPVPQSKQTRYRQTRCKLSKEPDDSSFEKSQSENESEFDDGEDYRSASSESDESTSSRSNGSEIEAVATHGANTRRASRSRAARREDESSRSESRAVPTRRARSGASQSCPAKYEDHSSGSESRDITTRVTRRGASQSLSGRRNSETSTRPLQRKCASAGVRRESDDATRTPRARTFRSFENNDHSASEFEDNVSNKATENGLKSRTAKKRKGELYWTCLNPFRVVSSSLLLCLSISCHSEIENVTQEENQVGNRGGTLDQCCKMA